MGSGDVMQVADEVARGDGGNVIKLIETRRVLTLTRDVVGKTRYVG